MQKEIAKRHVQNMLSKEKFAGKISNEKLPNLVSEHHSHLIKRGKGIKPSAKVFDIRELKKEPEDEE